MTKIGLRFDWPLHQRDPDQDQHAAQQLHRPGTLPSTKAMTTAKITSVSDTNDASELPSRRTAAMPLGYASTALIKINNSAGSHQPTDRSARP